MILKTCKFGSSYFALDSTSSCKTGKPSVLSTKKKKKKTVFDVRKKCSKPVFGGSSACNEKSNVSLDRSYAKTANFYFFTKVFCKEKQVYLLNAPIPPPSTHERSHIF